MSKYRFFTWQLPREKWLRKIPALSKCFFYMRRQPNLAEIVDMDTAQIFALTGNEKVKDVISKLRFLSKINPGEKINVKELFVRDNNDVWQRVLRTMRNFTAEHGESKETTLSFIEAVADEAINLIFVYRHHKNDRFKQAIADLIVQNLEDSKVGLRNLTKTYQDDRKFISDIEAVLQTLDARVSTLRNQGYANGLSDQGFSDFTGASESNDAENAEIFS